MIPHYYTFGYVKWYHNIIMPHGTILDNRGVND
jgi:hypothetical protein